MCVCGGEGGDGGGVGGGRGGGGAPDVVGAVAVKSKKKKIAHALLSFSSHSPPHRKQELVIQI